MVSVRLLTDVGDDRGSSFCVPETSLAFLEAARDVHLATIKPGRVRGNHYHARKREILLVRFADSWTFHWDEGDPPQASRREYSGEGAVVVEVPPLCSHAVENTGSRDLLIVSVSDEAYDPDHPDVVTRVLSRPTA